VNGLTVRAICLVVLYVLLSALGGCDADNPVAPSGSVLTINADPQVIRTDQTSMLRVTGVRPDGNALSENTAIRLVTTLGILSQPVVSVNENREAIATLTPDGRTGTATVTAFLADGSDEVGGSADVVILAASFPPVVVITSPDDGTVVPAGTVLTFAASATDAEDGSLSGSITWTSSIDGALGMGASVMAALSEGTHTVTADVTDSSRLTGSAAIMVTVNAAPPPPALIAAPMRLDKTHPRGGVICPDPFDPLVNLTVAGGGPLEFRIPSQGVDWLSVALGEGSPLVPFGGPMSAVGPLSGPVPSVLQLAFTCNVPAGDLDLQHDLVIQAVDPATGNDTGDPVILDVNVSVR
jgi:hypothetical protein